MSNDPLPLPKILLAPTMLSASEVLLRDVHLAVERIQDIAMMLRQREVEAALCDALEAAVREVGGAIARHEAAVTDALGAAALVRESAVERLNNTAPDAAAAAVEHQSPAKDDVGSPLQLEQLLHKPLPDLQAPLGPQEDPGELFEPPSLPAPSPLEQEVPQANQNPRAVLGDPLAALHALNEEELIALFS